MLWFFVVTQLQKPEGAKGFEHSRVSGFLVALDGVYQFAIAVNVPAHWTDLKEGYVRTRVFSIFTTPNMLAGYLTLLIPIAVGLFMGDKSKPRKVYYAGAAATMSLCLLFTMARQGWIVFGISLIVYVWFKNKSFFSRLYWGCGIIHLCMFFLPSVSSRILHLLSPDYIASSMAQDIALDRSPGNVRAEFLDRNGARPIWFGGIIHKLNNSPSLDNII